ncbi:hypothetical protein AF72_11860 [Xylella taiwanensis]|uniref:Uncharacterized protein n=1 Tax=Xylella taiwanensis TaxID=1444770 RepID=Z9JGE5_9GAMM|nr:hypothetical protein AB672_07640 [Xylella taiwanensis]EWS77264.1 hypothetical protein AF72_11860 [Xylella taiwanensis]
MVVGKQSYGRDFTDGRQKPFPHSQAYLERFCIYVGRVVKMLVGVIDQHWIRNAGTRESEAMLFLSTRCVAVSGS